MESWSTVRKRAEGTGTDLVTLRQAYEEIVLMKESESYHAQSMEKFRRVKTRAEKRRLDCNAKRS